MAFSNNTIEELLHLMELEPLEVNLFRGESRDIGTPRVFGGQVLAQSMKDRFTRYIPIFCVQATPRLPLSITSIAAVMAVVSRHGGWWPSSMAGRFSPWPHPSSWSRKVLNTSSRCRTFRCRRTCPRRARFRKTISSRSRNLCAAGLPERVPLIFARLKGSI